MTLLSHPALAVAFAIFIWWFSTGVVFVIARKGADHEWRIALIATTVALLALFGLFFSARSETVAGSYVAFGSALLVWGWHELMFLLGFIAGPRRFSATRGLTGKERFQEAFATVRDHELAIAGTAVLIILLTMGASNTVGLWTFILLWVMRVSSKLSIFLGARNSLSEMIPGRLHYLTTYFRTDRTTILLPLVILSALGVFVWLCTMIGGLAEAHQVVGMALLTTLLGLAILEHLFLMLPVPDAMLWLWAAPSKTERRNVKDDPAGETVDRGAVKGEGVSWT